MLKREDKQKVIDKLAESLVKSTIVIATDYRGLTAKDMVNLRRQLRAEGIDYKVSKNTLTKFATEKTGHLEIQSLLSGPLAIAIGYDDVIKPAKVLNDFIKSGGANLQIKGGLLGTKFITRENIINLAMTPPREVLIAILLSQLSSPLQSLHSLLSSPLRGLAYSLQARIEQLQNI